MIVDDIDIVSGIAYDWVHKNMYWADSGKKTIELLTMYGKRRKRLFDTNLDEVRGIAVDPRDEQKWLYWADWGKKPKIERAGLDGSRRALVVATNLGWPNDITIDYAENRLYWTDGKLLAISSCDLDGQNIREVLNLSDRMLNLYSLAVFKDHIYWDDWHFRKIFRADKTNATSFDAVTRRSSSMPMGLTVYHEKRQPNGKYSSKFSCLDHLSH